jgi:hypothetical protein
MAININWDKISEWEGGSRNEAYTLPSQQFPKSGVTIGTGFDLGSKTPEFLSQIGIEPDLINQFLPYLGLQSARAEETLQAKPLRITQEQAKNLDIKSKTYYANQIAGKYNATNPSVKFEDLSTEQQTVLASLSFQYGNMPTQTPKTWELATKGDWFGVDKELRNFGDKHTTRRKSEADYLQEWLFKPEETEGLKTSLDANLKKTEELKKENVEKTLESKVKEDVEEVVERKIEDKEYLTGEFKPREFKRKTGLTGSYTGNYPIDDGELLIDRQYNDSEYRKFLAEDYGTFGEKVAAAVSENSILSNAYELFSAPMFEPDENWTWAKDEQYIKEKIKEYAIPDEMVDYLTGAVSRQNFDHSLQKLAKHARNREMLSNSGWTGIGLEIGAWLLDPVNLVGYGLLNKSLKGISLAENLTRSQKFVKGFARAGAYEGVATSVIGVNNPNRGLTDVIIASALGGTLGGGVNALLAKAQSNVAKAVIRNEIVEAGEQLTKKGEKFLKGVNKLDDTKPTKLQQEMSELVDPLDTTVVADKELMFGRFRDLPLLFLASMTRSGTLGRSLSPLAKAFGFNTLEDPVGWAKTGSRKGFFGKNEVVSQGSTVEAIRDTMVMQVNALVYGDLSQALGGYIKENGGVSFFKYFSITKKREFMVKVKQAMIALGKVSKNEPLSEFEKQLLANKHIRQGATAYSNGFAYWAQKLKNLGIEGAEDLEIFRGYVPRKMSLQAYADLESKIGEDGIIQLIRDAIMDVQPLIGDASNPAVKVTSARKLIPTTAKKVKEEIVKLEEKLKKAKTDDAKNKIANEIETLRGYIDDTGALINKANDGTNNVFNIDKATLLARSIVKLTKYNGRHGGFDIEKLLNARDPEKLRAYIDDIFDHLDQSTRDDLFNGLKNNIKLLTSGRLKERIRLNENFETTINGHRVRVDDMFENDIDLLWHSYTNEMAGWASLSEKFGIKSRDAWTKYQNQIFNDIDASYQANYKGSELFKNATIKEEKETVKSAFNALMGRSSEDGDPTSLGNTVLRSLRKYNFTRVLNQVGIAQLPEFAVATSQQGWRLMFNEAPLIRKMFGDMDTKGVPDTFFKDMAIIGSSNGDEYIYRLFGSYEVGERGIASATNFSKKFNNVEAIASNFEKGTGFASGLFSIDSVQRKIAMRVFVHRLAEDLIKVSEGGKNIANISTSRLNRYKILGLTEKELQALAKEFNSSKVVTESNVLGTRVLSFKFQEFEDQALVKKFALAVNRYTKRAVQYNFIGDGQRFFTDKAFGKTMGQFRQFVMTAWSKQFLHNVAMADAQTATTFLMTSLIGGSAYYAQTHFNAIGMSDSEKRKFLKKRLGEKGDYTKLALASFQRAGWSSLMPSYLDMVTAQLSPENRFNTRSSGQDINLITGNPSYDLIFGKAFPLMGNILKSARSDYNFSQADLRRFKQMLPYQNMYGVNQFLNYAIENSGLPKKGSINNN